MQRPNWMRPADEDILHELCEERPDYLPLVANRLGMHLGYVERRCSVLVEHGLVEWEETGVHGARTFYDAADNTANGVLGDQTDATPEKGERLFEAASEQLVKLCEWLVAQDFEELMPEPHV